LTQSDSSDVSVGEIPRSAGVDDSVLDHIGSFEVKNLIDRLKVAYAAARRDPQQKHEFANLTADNAGLHWTANDLLWIPQHEHLRQDCVESVHSHPYAGHYGVRRTYQLLSRTFDWPKMLVSVEAFVRCCDSCQRVKAPRH
jgi:hypothetical protein